MKEAADTTKLNSTSNKTQRSFYVFYGLVLVAGGLVFSWGGSSHPPTDTTLGVIGSVIPITETSSIMLSPTRRGNLVILRS